MSYALLIFWVFNATGNHPATKIQEVDFGSRKLCHKALLEFQKSKGLDGNLNLFCLEKGEEEQVVEEKEPITINGEPIFSTEVSDD